MDFETYMNLGGDKDISGILSQRATAIREGIRSKNNLSNQYSELETYLNQIFYPEQNGVIDNDGKEFSNNLMNTLRKVYEEKADKIITSDIGDVTYKGLEKAPSLDESQNVSRRTVRVLQRQYNEVTRVLNSLTETDHADELLKIVEEVEQKYGDVMNIINDIIQTYGDSGSNNQIITEKFINKQGGNGAKILNAINGLSALYNTFNNAGLIILNTDYGDFLEYGLGLLSKDIDVTGDKTAGELLEYLDNNIVKGGTRVTRGGGVIDLQMDSKVTQHFTKKEITNSKGQSEIHWNYGPISLDFDPASAKSVNTGASKQGKVDVILELPEATGVTGKFRISAKNWKTIDDLRDLGSTTLLDAISRSGGVVSDGEEIIDSYAFAMQNPQDAFRNAADELARISIFADIVMGFSQEEGYADTLVINDRSRSRILVRNIPELILDSVEKNLDKLTIKGYDVSGLYNEAQAARTLVMNIPNESDTSRHQYYLQLFKNIIKGIEVSVQFMFGDIMAG